MHLTMFAPTSRPKTTMNMPIHQLPLSFDARYARVDHCVPSFTVRASTGGPVPNPVTPFPRSSTTTDRGGSYVGPSFENVSLPHDHFRGVHHHFEELAASIADGVTLQIGARNLDRAQADLRANRLARHLRASGVDPRTTVAICLHDIGDRVCTMLAVLKAGAGCIILDPNDPPRSATAALEETHAAALIVRGGQTGCAAEPGAHVVDLDAVEAILPSLSGEPLGISVGPASPVCTTRIPLGGNDWTVQIITHAAMIERVMRRSLAPHSLAEVPADPATDTVTEVTLRSLLDVLTPTMPPRSDASIVSARSAPAKQISDPMIPSSMTSR